MNFKTFKVYALATLLFVPLCSFAQTQDEKEDTRVEINFKQRHSKPSNDLYADGIKIKRDLSLIKEAQEERILDMDEIPADDLYGGIWNNRYVNTYGAIDNVPQTYNINLANFTMPSMGHVTSNYGPRRRRMHHGIDLKVQIGDTIYAAFDGKVRVTEYERRGYGYYVVLRHSNGLETVYGHLSKFLVSDNQVVKSGEPIALGGNTGRSTGSHLHFELRFLGRSINPTYVIDFENKVCHKDQYMVNINTLGKPGQKYNKTRASSTYVANKKGSATTNKYATGTVKYYRIKKGDTLATIAKRHGISVTKLCSLNSMSTKEKLKIGRSLRIS
ncbi:MAG: M23 family metallopeptidase [Dysgonomonas sp.]|nr:M23 family metallopeptidase [Dysgonomonas sp.]